MSNKPSSDVLLVAIRAKCLDCCGGMRKEVHNCKIADCPLWPYRRSEPREKTGSAKGQISVFDFTRKEVAL